MERRAIATPGAPAAIGPYVQAVQSGDLLFLSGQIPLDPATGEMVGGDITVQTRRVLDNMTAVLTAAGATPRDVVKTTVFLVNLAHFVAMNAVYAEYFGDQPPARSTVQVAALPRGSAVEIEAICRIPAP